MRKAGVYLVALGLFAGGAGYVLAEEVPPNMKVVPAPKPAASPTPAQTKSGRDHAHMQGMQHGAQQMHDQMMHDHQMGMQNMQQQPANGMGPQGTQGAMPMQPGKGCCPDKGMKPADKPMPMKDM